MGEEVRRAVEREEIDHPSSPEGRVTVSVGIATTIPVDDRPAALVEAADRALYRAKDRALYRAKDRGRNRVEVAGSEDLAAAGHSP